MQFSSEIEQFVAKIDRRKLVNNTQRALYALLTSKRDWVSRNSIRVNSVGSRLRDLRKPEFGGFRVECVTGTKLGKNTVVTTRATGRKVRQTFYRIAPSSVTLKKVINVFEGVVAA